MIRLMLVAMIAATPFVATQCKEDGPTRPCPPSECIIEKDSFVVWDESALYY